MLGLISFFAPSQGEATESGKATNGSCSLSSYCDWFDGDPRRSSSSSKFTPSPGRFAWQRLRPEGRKTPSRVCAVLPRGRYGLLYWARCPILFTPPKAHPAQGSGFKLHVSSVPARQSAHAALCGPGKAGKPTGFWDLIIARCSRRPATWSHKHARIGCSKRLRCGGPRSSELRVGTGLAWAWAGVEVGWYKYSAGDLRLSHQNVVPEHKYRPICFSITPGIPQ